MAEQAEANNEALRRAQRDVSAAANRLRAERSSLSDWADTECARWPALFALMDGLEGHIALNDDSLSLKVSDFQRTDRLQHALSEGQTGVTVSANFDDTPSEEGWKARIVFHGQAADKEIVQLAHELRTDDGQSALARILLRETRKQQRAGQLQATLGGDKQDPTTKGRFDQAATRTQILAWLYCCQTLLEGPPVLPTALDLPGGRTIQLQDAHVGAAKAFGLQLLSVIAMELALKLGIEQETGVPAPSGRDGHDLLKLAKNLPTDRLVKIDGYFSEYLVEHGKSPERIMDLIKKERNAFVNWRYVAELTPAWPTGSLETDAVVLYGAALCTAMTCFRNPADSKS